MQTNSPFLLDPTITKCEGEVT